MLDQLQTSSILPLGMLMLAPLHLAATWGMVGLIWFVQIVHYPLMSRVPPEQFPGFAKEHAFYTTFVVMPLMFLEAGTALLLLMLSPPGEMPLHYASLGALVTIWLSTFCIQVPLHNRLQQRFSSRDHRLLVQTNWLRTVLWTVRGVLAVTLLVP